MHTPALIRRHINQLKEDKPFSIREFLNYGSRNAVDQIFHRLVKSGRIIRIARGLFIKDTSPIPAILEIALAKANAFGKKLAIHGTQAAHQLKLNGIDTEDQAIYACNGSSSSFRFGDIRIRFIGTSQRKINLGNDLTGMAIRALWYLGETNCSAQLINDALLLFNRNDRKTLRQKLKFMPAWLANYFIGSDKRSAQTRKLKNGFQSFFNW